MTPQASPQADFKATPKQDEFLRAMLSGKYRHLLFGGAAGGGKTIILCAAIQLLARLYPGSRWAIIRKDLPSLKRTVLETWNRLAPRPLFGEINKSDWVVRCTNGSSILFLSASEDTDPDFQRLRSLELNGAAVEECNEVSADFVDVLSSRLGRWPVPGKAQPPILQIYSCNPNQAWPKARFYDRYVNGTLPAHYFYLPALVTDNPHLGEPYLDQLRDLPPRQRSVFFDGNWENADEPDQLIKAEWIELAAQRTLENPNDRAYGLGVDVARYGDDETVIAERRGWLLRRLEAWKGIDIAQTANVTALRAAERNIDGSRIRVDTVGLGAGVADVLFRQYRIKPTEFIAGAKPVGYHKFLKFKNLRSEQWWNLRELLQNGPLCIDPAILREFPKLIADLTAPRYDMDSDKTIAVEPKDSIKARIGRSTDYGDAVVQCFANMQGAAARMDALNNIAMWKSLGAALRMGMRRI